MKRILALAFLLLFLTPSLRAENDDPASAPQRQRPKVGLVLSGGGAKGMAHIGALKAIEELDIPIDYVVGTSIGSIIAGIYALGYSADELDTLVRSQDWDLLMKDRVSREKAYYTHKKDEDQFIVRFPFMNHQMLREETEANAEKKELGVLRNLPSALVAGHNLDQLFTKLSVGYQDDIDFNTLPIPFACVAVDLNTKEEVVFHSGNIVTAIRASMSIPGYFAPVQIGDQFLIDGGMRNNMPVDVAKEMGADYIICVDLHHFKKERPDNDQTLPEMFATMLTMMNGDKYQSGRANSDIIIEPNTSAYGVLDFDERSVDALIDSGRVAASRVYPKLRSLAEHLKEYPDEKTARPPKAVNLNRGSVKISQVEIKGTDPDDMAWLLSKTDIAPGKTVSGKDMDDAMSFFYNTRSFRKVNYSIAGKEEEGYRLKINFLPQRIHQAALGFRFDSEEMASILMGVSLNKNKLFGSKLDTKLELGVNSDLKIAYSYTFRNLTRMNFTITGIHTKFDTYSNLYNIDEQVEYMLNTTDRFNIFRAQADYQIVGWRNAIIRFGASFTYNSCLSTNASPDAHNMGFEFSNHFWQGFLNWHFDSLDDNYFPRHGVAFDLFGAAIRCYGSPSYEGRFDLKAAIPLGQRVTLIPQLYNRWMTSDYDRYSSNLIGGYMPERYTPWQMPFVGINNTYISSNTIDIARIDLSINLFGQHYLNLIGNYLAEWWLNSPVDKFRGYFGTGAAYAVNTIVGPIQLCAHWSTLSHKFGMHFSLGYYF